LGRCRGNKRHSAKTAEASGGLHGHTVVLSMTPKLKSGSLKIDTPR
jgi:hypothetical protein